MTIGAVGAPPDREPGGVCVCWLLLSGSIPLTGARRFRVACGQMIDLDVIALFMTIDLVGRSGSRPNEGHDV